MRIVFGLVLFAGIGIAGYAVSIAKDRFDQYQAALTRQQSEILPTTEVYVVNRQVRYGDVLTRNDVSLIRWPEGHVPFGAFTEEAQLFPENGDLRMVLRVMERNEPVLVSKVTNPGEDAGVASRLEEGMRAIALTVNVVSGVSGFLRPGDHVDVYWTGSDRDGQSVTRLIKSSVQIIAIDQVADEDRNDPTIARTITVSAPPAEIATLTQAQASGSLTLALVGVGDTTLSDNVQASTDALLGEVEVAQEEESPEICTVRNRRGSEVVLIQVPCTN